MSDLSNAPNAAYGEGGGTEPLVMTEELIQDFLDSQERRGLANYTMVCYKQRIYRLYRDLPPDKCLYQNTLTEWRDAMYGRGISRTKVMAAMVTANKFVEYCQREDLMSNLVKGDAVRLTRQDYYHLLDIARARGKYRSYLLVRAFGAMGLEVAQLSLLTVEAVREGKVILDGRDVQIPDAFRTELLCYAEKQGITAGEILVSRRGTPLHRSNVSCEVKALCRAAGLPEGDGYPSQIRLLHLNTRKEVLDALEPLVNQFVEMLLASEPLGKEGFA